jgi:DNA-binding MarR family transcriptional regulator
MSSDAFCIIVNLIRAHAMVDERLAGELAAVHGLAVNEAMLLMHLERAPMSRLTRIDLARRLHLSPSTVTRMAAPLEKNGLVTREPDVRDARLAYVTISKTGLSRIADVRTTLERKSAEFFRDRWTADEIETLSTLMGRLTSGEIGDIV